MKKLVLMIAAVALVASASVQAKEKGGERKGPPKDGRGYQMMMEQILPSFTIEKLNLTASQKANYDALCASFKNEAAQWRAQNPVTEADKEAMKKARESGDKEAMKAFMEKRKGMYEIRKKYAEQFKATLTDEQKSTLSAMRGQRATRECPKGEKK